jgi:Fic family protein
VVGSTEPVHAGFAPDQIEAGLQDALSALRAKGLFGSERFLLFHYLLEDIHPFYDGNGRLGRFLLSLGFQNEAESPFAFLVSRSIEEKKGVYYQAFREAEKAHNFADLTAFVEPMLLLLQEGAAKAVGELKTKRAAFEKEKERLGALRGGAKRKVAILLLEASFYSAFGISNEEILSETKISRRALQYALKEFREEGMLLEKKIGKTTYQKLRLAEEG